MNIYEDLYKLLDTKIVMANLYNEYCLFIGCHQVRDVSSIHKESTIYLKGYPPIRLLYNKPNSEFNSNGFIKTDNQMSELTYVCFHILDNDQWIKVTPQLLLKIKLGK